MPAPKINGFTIAYTAIGGIILWSGITGTTLTTAFKDLLSGQAPSQNEETIQAGATLTDTSSLTGGTGSTTITTTASGIANDALTYVGNRYVWGGAPGTVKGKDNGTDCSGFVNMVLGRDLGGAIPGYKAGQYTGSTHGPTSQMWLLWGGAKTISKSQAQAGDLACWVTHIGFFTDNGQHVVSSLDHQSGVVVTTVAGATPGSEPLAVRRYSG